MAMKPEIEKLVVALAHEAARRDHEVTNIVEMPQPLGIYASELYLRSSDFLDAVDTLVSARKDKHSHACYALLLHALELSLKSFLAARQEPKKELKRLGHNLAKLFDACVSMGLREDPVMRTFIEGVDDSHREHDFRYPTGFMLRVPRPDFSVGLLRKLNEAILPVIRRANSEDQLRFAEMTRDMKGKKIRWSD